MLYHVKIKQLHYTTPSLIYVIAMLNWLLETYMGIKKWVKLLQ